jgi:DNA mismatch repair protein MutL
MPKINLLDKHISELIAAGEVVERPASVIKELVENSIDAGAKIITVEIKNGGITYIRITDNGCGIASEDVPLAFLRHATSKIKSSDDLDSISTLGFRGEALAAISSVARVRMLTKTADDLEGTLYEIEGGVETEYCPVGCSDGTTIMISDLFYNTPARMKFLKKDVSEGNACANVIDRIALSHPEISF